MDPKVASRVEKGWKPKAVEAETPETTPAPAPASPPARKAEKAHQPRKRKTQYVLDDDLDEKLAAFCRRHRKTRSAVVSEALREKLTGVVITFRGKAGEELTAA